MNVEIGTAAMQFPEKEYIFWIFLVVCAVLFTLSAKLVLVCESNCHAGHAQLDLCLHVFLFLTCSFLPASILFSFPACLPMSFPLLPICLSAFSTLTRLYYLTIVCLSVPLITVCVPVCPCDYHLSASSYRPSGLSDYSTCACLCLWWSVCVFVSLSSVCVYVCLFEYRLCGYLTLWLSSVFLSV